MNLILFILICFGMTQILAYGKIFDRIRPKHYFFHCPMCIGFHVGWLVYLICGWSFGIPQQFEWFLMGCLSSGTSYFLSMLIDDDGLKINNKTYFNWD